MRVGVVGCGYWGSKHVRVLCGLREVETTAVIDPREDRQAELAESFPGVRAYSSLEQVLSELDAVIVATPPASHSAVALQALEAGKHVLVEKPLATTSRDAAVLIQAAEDIGVTLMVGHTFEYNAAVWKLRELVRKRALGRVYHIDSARLNLGLYQRDCNVIWDLAPHDISIINHVLDQAPSRVHAWGYRHACSDVEDVAYLRLDYEAIGVTAQIHVSWLEPCKVRRLTAIGSRQMAVYNDLADDERVRIYDKGVDPAQNGQPAHDPPMSYRYGGIQAPYIAFQEPLRLEVRHFIECSTSGERPVTDGHNGLNVVRALEAAERSLHRGESVNLEELIVQAS